MQTRLEFFPFCYFRRLFSMNIQKVFEMKKIDSIDTDLNDQNSKA